MAYYSGQIQINQFIDELVSKLEANGWTKNIVPTTCIPKMTSANSPAPYVVSASSTYSSSYAPDFAFNLIDSTFWSATAPSGWLKIDLGIGNEKVIDSYAITSTLESLPTLPKDWTFEGSQDDANWTVLDTRTGEIEWGIVEKRIYKFTNTTAYRYYRLNVTANNGYQYLNIGQLDLNEPVATSVTTGNYDVIMTSTGTSGTDAINLLICKGNSKDSSSNYIRVGYIESFDSSKIRYIINKPYYFNAHTTATIPSSTILTYYLDITLDRVFFSTVLDPSVANTATNACYLGLPRRVSTEADSSAVCLGLGIQAPSSGSVTVLKNRQLLINQPYSVKYVPHNYSPSVWGNTIFISPMFIEGTYEGIRGELSGVYTCRAEGIVNEDEILVDGVRYKVFVITSYGNNAFPNSTILIKMPTV